MACNFCKKNNDNSFVPLNETVDYSGIEIAIHEKGMLRCRYFENEETFKSQDVINIKYCPMCGDTLNK